jgi:7-alpha-hydroxysteroid dehydrogenase
MSFSIEGKTAIVTGAANGVGLAIARHFVDQGANVMFADIDEARLSHECGEIPDEDGNIRYFAGDLRERLTLANLLSATIDAFDRIDILINASRQVLPSDPLDLDDTTLERLMMQNVTNTFRLSQMVAKRMIKQAAGKEEGQAGAIVNVSSIAARRTQPELLAFSVSMAALDQLTRSFAVSMAENRIRVNSVALGSVMSASLRQSLKDNDGYREEIEENTPLARIASPAELAEAVQFLSCENAGFVTGQIMTIDGGRTLLDPVNAPAH